MDFDDIPPANDEFVAVPPPPVPEVTEVPEVPAVPEYDPFNSEALVVPPTEEVSVLPDPQEDALTLVSFYTYLENLFYNLIYPRIFTREWTKKLEEKRASEFEYEKSVREKAADELASWKSQREIRLAAKKDSNRADEQSLVETLSSESQNLKPWDRITKLIDAGETVEGKGSDTGRMRKLFIHLKNEPLESTRAASAITA